MQSVPARKRCDMASKSAALLLIRSSFLRVIEENDRAVIWHSLFGAPKIVSIQTLRFLDLFIQPSSIETVLEEYDLGPDAEDIVGELVADHYLVPEGLNERELLASRMKEYESAITNGSLINYLELIMSEACNFRCTYCIHFNNLETSERIANPKKFMRFDIAKEAIDRFLLILREHHKTLAEINFGGGEPLLAWPVIREVIDYCRSTYGTEFTFRFSINTNASLITKDIAKMLKEHSVEIASSLDGLREANDRVRMTKLGAGTFDAIIGGMDNLAAENYPMQGIAVTVDGNNFPYIDEAIIDWASQRNMKEVRIDIDVVGMIDIPVETIVAKLIRIREYAKRFGIDVAGFWSRAVENLNYSTLESHVAFCGAVRGNSMCVGPSGSIYGCGYSNTQLGSLIQIESFYKPQGSYHNFVRGHLTGAMEMCRGCMIEGQCAGGCNITQEFARAVDSAKIERMCEFYRGMTRELLLEDLRADA